MRATFPFFISVILGSTNIFFAISAALHTEYDFIIVGAGTAGCALAYKLSSVPELSVLLIDSGFDHEKEWEKEYKEPLAFEVQNARTALLKTYFDVFPRIKTTPVDPLKAILTKFCSASALGGLTNCNDQIWTRGDQKTWDFIGNGLEWENVLPDFKKIENVHLSCATNQALRGTVGPITIKQKPFPAASNPLNPLETTLSQLLGIKILDDYNAGPTTGLSEAQYAVTEFSPAGSMIHGKRQTSYQSFLVKTGALSRPNLTLITGSSIRKIGIECGCTNRATGVSLQTTNGISFIAAKKEIILAAGALNTPIILMLSGIGPRKDLDAVGIRPQVDIPGVGSNLHDHLHLGTVLFSDKTLYPADYKPPQLIVQADSGSSIEPVTTPDLEYIFTPSTPADGKLTWSVDIYVTKHALRGKLTLKSKVPGLQPTFTMSPHLPYAEKSESFFPEIAPVLVHAVRFLEPLLDAKSLTYIERPLGNDFKQIRLMKNQTDDQILNQFKLFFSTATFTDLSALGSNLFVATRYGGTCKLGSRDDITAVVDQDFKVRSFENLRICDASILPIPIQSHMDAPLMMLGYKLGTKLCKEYQTIFDFIIVGSGCAGTILASRLSEDPTTSVLCIDAGTYYKTWDVSAPQIEGRTLDNVQPVEALIDHLGGWVPYYPSPYTIGWRTISPASINAIRSNTLFGGGSTINNGDYWRGGKWVFDYWASPKGLNLPGWSWDDVTPFHEKVEFAITHDGKKQTPIDPLEWPGRGKQGPIAVEIGYCAPDNPTQPTLAHQLAQCLNLPFIKDYQVPSYDESNNLITTYLSLKQVNRTRVVTGYIDDSKAAQRENLTLIFQTPVSHIIFEDTNTQGGLRATGIMTYDGKVYKANKEVIVNCGAIISPKLLMLSGIGDSNTLSQKGIASRIDAPGVGKNLADHTAPLLESFKTTQLQNHGAQLTQHFKAILKTHENTFNNWPDYELALTCRLNPATGETTLNCQTYDLLCPVNGEILIRSNDPQINPEILNVHNVFDSRGEIRSDLIPQWLAIYRIWLTLFLNLKGTVMKEMQEAETAFFVRDTQGQVKPNPTDEEILNAYKKALAQEPDRKRYKTRLDKGHFMGTCRMGNRKIDPWAVVDENFKVYGTTNVRVIDNSVIPSTPDGKLVVGPFGHPTGWLYMFGEKISATLKKEYKLS